VDAGTAAIEAFSRAVGRAVHCKDWLAVGPQAFTGRSWLTASGAEVDPAQLQSTRAPPPQTSLESRGASAGIDVEVEGATLSASVFVTFVTCSGNEAEDSAKLLAMTQFEHDHVASPVQGPG
jgi:hypothetical protein